MTIPGTPAKENPLTLNGQAAFSGWQCRPTWNQIDGIWLDKCGSLARIGLPVAVNLPERTHEFEPIPSPVGPSKGSSLDRLAWAAISSGLMPGSGAEAAS